MLCSWVLEGRSNADCFWIQELSGSCGIAVRVVVVTVGAGEASRNQDLSASPQSGGMKLAGDGHFPRRRELPGGWIVEVRVVRQVRRVYVRADVSAGDQHPTVRDQSGSALPGIVWHRAYGREGIRCRVKQLYGSIAGDQDLAVLQQGCAVACMGTLMLPTGVN